MNALPLIVSSAECIRVCLTKLQLYSISFKPRHSDYIEPYESVQEISTKMNHKIMQNKPSNNTTIILSDLTQLSIFHSVHDISLLLSAIKAKQIIILCSNKSLFNSLQCYFTQSIEETADSFNAYSTLTKKSRVVLKATHKVVNEVDNGQDLLDVKEDRDSMTLKQAQSKHNTTLPFEKMVLRFGDDSDVSEFSDDDDLDV